MRFSKVQIETIYAIARVHRDMWAMKLDSSEISREGISDQEIYLAVKAKWSLPGEPCGIVAPRASQRTTSGRTRWEVDYLGGVRVEVRRLDIDYVISFEADAGALVGGIADFQKNETAGTVELTARGIRIWILRSLTKACHLMALMNVVRAIGDAEAANAIEELLLPAILPGEQ